MYSSFPAPEVGVRGTFKVDTLSRRAERARTAFEPELRDQPLGAARAANRRPSGGTCASGCRQDDRNRAFFATEPC
ncbi:unnamed protein product [Protopolystoma xenopodis]|uniref:Uncharacterized protein n=1 Tax=Protopolystoma xenopodis TaxID=117903 RepID=A0A3S5BDG6_9PLAT|nr:unnamed protein product [Protopolystoma xenopodis]